MFLGYHLTHTHLLVWNWIELIWDPTWLLTDKGWYFPRRATWPSTSRVLGKPYVWGNSLADTYNVYIYIYYTYYIEAIYPRLHVDHILKPPLVMIIPVLGQKGDPRKNGKTGATPLTKRSSWRSCWETVRPQTAALNKNIWRCLNQWKPWHIWLIWLCLGDILQKNGGYWRTGNWNGLNLLGRCWWRDYPAICASWTLSIPCFLDPMFTWWFVCWSSSYSPNFYL